MPSADPAALCCDTARPLLLQGSPDERRPAHGEALRSHIREILTS